MPGAQLPKELNKLLRKYSGSRTTYRNSWDTELYEWEYIEKDSARHGLYRKFSRPDGTLYKFKFRYFDPGMIKEAYYKNGKRNGTNKTWYYNGELEKDYNYENDKLHGICTIWWLDGKIKHKDYYENGIIIADLLYDLSYDSSNDSWNDSSSD